LGVGDFDGDGNPDIAAGSTVPGGISVWVSDGAGGWRRWGSPTAFGEVHGLAVGDLDHDGLDDIVASTWGTMEGEGIWVWLSCGDGTWRVGEKPTDFGRYEDMTLADVNSDGNLDIVAANATSEDEGGVQVWLGDGKGRWTTQVGPCYAGTFRDVVVADFDGDGNPDIAVVTYLKGIRIWLGDGEGGWKEGKWPTKEGNFWDVASRDLDGDGSPDLLASSLEGEGIRFWLNDGGGGWKEVKGKFPSQGTYHGLILSDLNNDGRTDLAAVSYEEGVKVWLIFGPGGRGTTSGDTVRATASYRGHRRKPEGNKVYTEVSGKPEYLVGPGDVLEITSWEGATETISTARVRDDGTISYRFLEDIKVEGLTTRQVDSLLTERLREFVQSPRIDVSVKEYHSKKVFLFGAVGMGGKGPGIYALKGKTTVLDLLMEAGGPAPDADLKNVRITRNGRSFRVNLYDAIFKGDMSQNVVLDAGDKVVIPKVPETRRGVYVFGEVKNPGLYPFSEDMDVLTAISEAGGYTDEAVLKSVIVARRESFGSRIIRVDLERLIRKGDLTQNLRLRRGDVVFVPRTLAGNISKFFAKMRTISDFLFYPLDLYIRARTLYLIVGG